MKYNEEFKKDVIEYTINGIIKMYGYFREKAEKDVTEANLE